MRAELALAALAGPILAPVKVESESRANAAAKLQDAWPRNT